MTRPKTAPTETKACPICEKHFTARASRHRKYCSRDCSDVATAERYGAHRKKTTCKGCGETFTHRPGAAPLYCGIICSNTAKSRATAQQRADSLRGVLTGNGNSYTKERGQHQHRRRVEEHLGRKLTFQECVHHIDGDVNNNDLDNLRIVTRAEHMNIHIRAGKCSCV